MISFAIIQETGFDSPSASYSVYEKRIAAASKQGAKLIVLPELHSHRYFPQTESVEHFDLAESIPGPSTVFFSELAKKYHVVIVTSLFEKRAPGIYHNTSVVIEKTGAIAGIYRKMHIPDDPGFSEKFYFTPGDLGFTPIQTSVGNLGVLICWDQWFPEAARLMALQNADILIYPTAIGWSANEDKEEHARQLDAWITIQRSHAIANNMPVIACNRVGTESQIQFWGNSFISGPQGEILSQAGVTPQTLLGEYATSRTEQVRRIWPFFRDRRIDAYHSLNQRFLAEDLHKKTKTLC